MLASGGGCESPFAEVLVRIKRIVGLFADTDRTDKARTEINLMAFRYTLPPVSVPDTPKSWTFPVEKSKVYFFTGGDDEVAAQTW